jgi:hypothetical protein
MVVTNLEGKPHAGYNRIMATLRQHELNSNRRGAWLPRNMKVSGEGYRSFAETKILTLRSSSDFSCIGGVRRFIFRLPPTPEHREGMPKG